MCILEYKPVAQTDRRPTSHVLLFHTIYVPAQSEYVSSGCMQYDGPLGVWFNTDVIHIRRWRLNGGQEPPSRQTKCLGN